MSDFVVFNLGFMLGASKRLEYKQECREQCASLLRFIRKNGLNNELIEWGDGFPPDNFVLKASHLTDEGVSVMREGMRKWMAAQDRGRRKEDWMLLEKALQKFRSEHT